jgi:hypothetical protein
MDLSKSSSSTGLNRCFKVDLTLTIKASLYITESEYATLQPSNDVSVIIITTSFSMLQEKFPSCMFLCHELSNEIISEPGAAILEDTDFFSKTQIFLPFNFESGWTLFCIDMQKKNIIVLGFKGSSFKSKEMAEKILGWFELSSGGVNTFCEDWTTDDRTQDLPCSGSVDSGIYLLICAYFLASYGKYILYDPNDALNFRRSLRANLKNSIFPPLPKTTTAQLTQGSDGEIIVMNALLDLKRSKTKLGEN